MVQKIELPQSVANSELLQDGHQFHHHHTVTLYEVLSVIAYAGSYTNHPAHHPHQDPAQAHPPPPTTNTLAVILVVFLVFTTHFTVLLASSLLIHIFQEFVEFAV